VKEVVKGQDKEFAIMRKNWIGSWVLYLCLTNIPLDGPLSQIDPSDTG
jgi:hypothetical protein